jgi:hypothetical protein
MEETLLKYISPENLEVRYGGKMPNIESQYLHAHLENPYLMDEAEFA